MEWVFRRSPGYVLDDVRIGSLAQPKPVGMKEGSQKRNLQSFYFQIHPNWFYLVLSIITQFS
jgi:hypothetical protein